MFYGFGTLNSQSVIVITATRDSWISGFRSHGVPLTPVEWAAVDAQAATAA